MRNRIKELSIFALLFIVTICTTTLAGADHWNYFSWSEFPEGTKSSYDWEWVKYGFYYSIPFLLFLTFHEFGHYFMARKHGIKSSLPYYLPFIFGGMGMPAIGTLGAVIRLRSLSKTKKQYFDVGIAGPLAGFVVAVVLLVIGFTTLPANEEIYTIHPDYEVLEFSHGHNYQDHLSDHYKEVFESQRAYYIERGRDSLLAIGEYESLPKKLPLQTVSFFGKNLLYKALESFLVDEGKIPPSGYEVMHYPFLFAGLLALLFTALNLLPVGQLDGGHILYGLVGAKWFSRISPVIFIIALFYSGIGLPFLVFEEGKSVLLLMTLLYVMLLYFVLIRVLISKKKTLVFVLAIVLVQFVIKMLFPDLLGYTGWGVFLVILSRFVGVSHPITPDHSVSLDKKRIVLGVIALMIFVLCITPYPIELHEF